MKGESDNLLINPQVAFVLYRLACAHLSLQRDVAEGATGPSTPGADSGCKLD